jgi:hypothetical protein
MDLHSIGRSAKERFPRGGCDAGRGHEHSADARRDVLSSGSGLTGVTERIDEAGPGMNFEHQFWEVDGWRTLDRELAQPIDIAA